MLEPFVNLLRSWKKEKYQSTVFLTPLHWFLAFFWKKENLILNTFTTRDSHRPTWDSLLSTPTPLPPLPLCHSQVCILLLVQSRWFWGDGSAARLHVWCVCCVSGCADLHLLDMLSPMERKRQGYIHELIVTEENYVNDLQLVTEVSTHTHTTVTLTPGNAAGFRQTWWLTERVLTFFQIFHKPLLECELLTEKEVAMIFVNWKELIMCNIKLLK